MLAATLLALVPATPPRATRREDLYELRQELAASTDPGERLALLERMAALGPEEAAPEEVLEGVVACLQDSAAAVRARAIELIGATADEALRERAFAALLDATAAQLAAEDALLERTRTRLAPALEADAAAGDAGSAFPTLALEHTARQADLASTREALTRALAARREARALEALGSLLAPLQAEAADETVLERLRAGEAVARRASPLALGDDQRARRSVVPEAADGLVAALVDCACADGLAPALTQLELLETELEEAEEGLHRARRERPRERTQSHVTSADWETWEERRLAQLVAACEQRVEAAEGRAERLRERLAALAEDHDLPRVPAKALPARPWERWVRKAGTKLPALEDGDGGR